jgi:hypothetical protein
MRDILRVLMLAGRPEALHATTIYAVTNILVPPAAAAGGPISVPIVLTAAGRPANAVYVTVQ